VRSSQSCGDIARVHSAPCYRQVAAAPAQCREAREVRCVPCARSRGSVQLLDQSQAWTRSLLVPAPRGQRHNFGTESGSSLARGFFFEETVVPASPWGGAAERIFAYRLCVPRANFCSSRRPGPGPWRWDEGGHPSSCPAFTVRGGSSFLGWEAKGVTWVSQGLLASAQGVEPGANRRPARRGLVPRSLSPQHGAPGHDLRSTGTMDSGLRPSFGAAATTGRRQPGTPSPLPARPSKAEGEGATRALRRRTLRPRARVRPGGAGRGKQPLTP